MEFYENLKYLRKESKLTQEKLAEQLNISRQAVTKWESGQAMPDIQNLKAMSEIFGVTIDSLVGDVKNKKNSALKRKIDDIEFYIFAIFILILACAFSVIDFISWSITDENIKMILYISIVLISFITFVVNIKKCLKDNTRPIINMKDTLEAKKERKKYVTRKYLYNRILENAIFSLILSMTNMKFGIGKFIMSVINNYLDIICIEGIISFIEYKKLEKKSKELNKSE